MNIGYVVTSFPTLSESFVLNEVSELVRRGVNVHVFSLTEPEPSKSTDYVLHSELFQDRIHTFKGSLMMAGLRLSLIRSDAYIRAKYFVNLIRREKLQLDFIHAQFAADQAYVASQMAMALKLPHSITAHASDLYNVKHRERARRQMLRADAVVTISNYNAEHIRDLGVNPEKVHVIRTGVNLKKFSARPNNSVRQHLLLSISRLVEKKGLIFSIKAVKNLQKKYPTLAYTIVGSGPLERILKDAAQGLNVQFLKGISNDEVIQLLHECTVFVLPCIIARDGDRDGIPVALMEAMACEVPVISTRISGIPELIESGKEGILVGQRNICELERSVEFILQNQEAADIGVNARAKIERDYNIEKNITKLMNVFETLI
jgi:colanic acid/amylovoran biosynthesis glycosyltransferase